MRSDARTLFAPVERRAAARAASPRVAGPPRARLSRACRRAFRPVSGYGARADPLGACRFPRRNPRRRAARRAAAPRASRSDRAPDAHDRHRSGGRPRVVRRQRAASVAALRRALRRAPIPRHFKPCVGLLMETELWPNLVALAREADVPLYLVNARMSEKSARAVRALPGAHASDVRRALGHCGADRNRRGATVGAGRAGSRRHRQSEVRRRRDGPRRGAGSGAQSALRRNAPHLGGRIHPRRRGSDDPRRACRAPLATGRAHRHRPAPSAAIRESSPTSFASAQSPSCAAAATRP